MLCKSSENLRLSRIKNNKLSSNCDDDDYYYEQSSRNFRIDGDLGNVCGKYVKSIGIHMKLEPQAIIQTNQRMTNETTSDNNENFKLTPPNVGFRMDSKKEPADVIHSNAFNTINHCTLLRHQALPLSCNPKRKSVGRRVHLLPALLLLLKIVQATIVVATDGGGGYAQGQQHVATYAMDGSLNFNYDEDDDNNNNSSNNSEWLDENLAGPQPAIQRRQMTHYSRPTTTTTISTILEAPIAMNQFIHGPGVDLVALNRRRFELEHNHPGSRDGAENQESQLRRAELIESNIAAIPERVLSQLPDEVNRQLMESLATDPTFLLGLTTGPDGASEGGPEDPDGASIERLTKSCLTVHASSASPEQLNVTFHLYTKNNPLTPFIFGPHVTRNELIKSSPFDPRKSVKWITHGFHTNVDKSEWMVETKDKILGFEDANVILTDWRRGASPALAFYPKAAANAHVVAKMIVKMLRRLKNDIDFNRVHLIGHSLGAHIMGFVGSAFTEEYLYQQQQFLTARSERNPAFWQDNQAIDRNNQMGLIGRITACDPALPCFGPSSSAPNPNPQPKIKPVPHSHQQTTLPTITTTTNANIQTARQMSSNGFDRTDITDWTPSMWTHLRPDSAILVEVMHSNPGVMGYADPLGDFDFYPNGFERQPGCGNNNQEGGHNNNNEEHQQDKSSSSFMRFGARSKRQVNSKAGNENGNGNGNEAGGFMSSILKSVIPSRSGSRLSSTLDRFIKPIRDFVHGYTCSHHRSVEYMVESMYYERIPRDRKLDKDLVCQMVGYRCIDYISFKKGFCFACNNEMDCRAFVMSNSLTGSFLGATLTGYSPSLAQTFAPAMSQPTIMEKFKRNSLTFAPEMSATDKTKSISNLETHKRSSNSSMIYETAKQSLKRSSSLFKRVLPTFNHYNQNYKPSKRNQYYFDTKPTKDYCLNHYHLHVKYRWFRVRESVSVDGLTLSGTLATIIQDSSPIIFNKYTYQSYTMLITHSSFLGQIESLIIYGERIKPNLIDYIDVTYMSNLDPRIRSLGSTRLCRSQQNQEANLGGFTSSNSRKPSIMTSLFVRCAGPMV